MNFCVERPLFHGPRRSGATVRRRRPTAPRPAGRRSEGGILHNSSGAGKRKIYEGKRQYSQRMHSFSTRASRRGTSQMCR